MNVLNEIVKEIGENYAVYLLRKALREEGRGFDIVVDDTIDTTHTLIPAMILQPFIENAIEHGFFNIDYRGLIEIKILQLSANMLEIKVKDNGTGIQPSSKTYSGNLKEKSMAMDIVRNRLQILSYDTKTESRYSIIENEGVLITITLACKEKAAAYR